MFHDARDPARDGIPCAPTRDFKFFEAMEKEGTYRWLYQRSPALLASVDPQGCLVDAWRLATCSDKFADTLQREESCSATAMVECDEQGYFPRGEPPMTANAQSLKPEFQDHTFKVRTS